MATDRYDLVIIGAGSAGLVAAGLAHRLGAKVALVERDRVGGDCTWTGCVPSKALAKVARVAHDVRIAGQYGVGTSQPAIDMVKVRGYVRSAVQKVYQTETSDHLERAGIDVLSGSARFVDAGSIVVGDRIVRSRRFVIATGARAVIPPIEGLKAVPFATYENVFDNDRLPRRMIVVGGGPVGAELAQAYRRLGSDVTLVAPSLLPKEDGDVQRIIRRVFEREGIRFVHGRATAVHRSGDRIVVKAEQGEASGEFLLIATGRRPAVDGLGLDAAGVAWSERGIAVNSKCRTNARTIYAAGDVTGGAQFTHLAGWQAFYAVRYALLPSAGAEPAHPVPRVTFTDPEVAHVGPGAAELHAQYGDDLEVQYRHARCVDRAISDNDPDAFIKIAGGRDGRLLAATVVARRAGDMLGELTVALNRGMKIGDLARTMHAYPTYATGLQALATDMAVGRTLSGFSGRIMRGLSRIATRSEA